MDPVYTGAPMPHKIIPVLSKKDIPAKYKNTPISLLFEYHNLGREFDEYPSAKLLVAMCMDNRKYLRIPDNFAFIIRSGGANLRYSEFKVSFAVAVGHVKHIALIAHNHCAMTNLISKKSEFITGLVKNAGWKKEAAEDHFMNMAPMHEIGDERDFIVSEKHRLSRKYPKVEIAPLYYKVEDNRLYLIK